MFAMVISTGVVTLFVLALLLNTLLIDTSLACASGYTYNASADNCYLNTNNSATADPTTAHEITRDGLTFIDNTTGQFGTAGTVLGVGILLLIIAALGIAGYSKYKEYR